MQPNPEQHPSGPPAGWPSPGSGSRAPDPYGPPAAPVRTARPWWVALSALLMLLALIGGLGNQWVTDAIQRHVQRPRQFLEYLVRSDLTYAWRFNPRSSGVNPDRVWAAHLALVGTALVLTFLLVAVLARGRGGFWQTFVATWVSVVASTMIALYVFATVFNTATFYRRFGGRAQSIFFAAYPGAALFAALGFGLAVALVAAVVAVLVRRTELVPAGPVEPRRGSGDEFLPPGGPPRWGPPAPWGGGEAPRSGGEVPWGGGGDAPTATYEPIPEPRRDEPMRDEPMRDEPMRDDSTTELPRQDDEQHTTELPRSEPDDGGPKHLSE